MIDEGAEKKEQTEETYPQVLTEFRDKFSKMNNTEESARETAVLFINTYKNDNSLLEELLKIWDEATNIEIQALNCPLLADSILKSCDETTPEIKESFFPYIRKDFPYLYSTLNGNIRIKLENIIEGWKKQNIYSNDKIDELKFLMKMEFSPEIHNSELEIDLLTNGIWAQRYRINENCIEFAKMKENLQKNPNDKNLREITIKKCKAIFNEEIQAFKEHEKMIEELDKKIAKIRQYKREKAASTKGAKN